MRGENARENERRENMSTYARSDLQIEQHAERPSGHSMHYANTREGLQNRTINIRTTYIGQSFATCVQFVPAFLHVG